MEWWQYLVISVVSASVGAFLAYFFNRLGAKNERVSIEKERFQSTIAAILGEIHANENIAKKPWTGKLLPFLANSWTIYKQQIPDLPKHTIQQIDEFYLDVILANTIVNKDLYQLKYGTGYLDNEYRDMCKQIRGKSLPLIETLNQYLQ
ncbi:hypothetical protein ACFLVO_02890 [Chloroflexota bacterium]